MYEYIWIWICAGMYACVWMCMDVYGYVLVYMRTLMCHQLYDGIPDRSL